MKAAAVACWVLAWVAMSVSAAAIWSATRGHERARGVVFAAAAAAVLLAGAGVVLW